MRSTTRPKSTSCSAPSTPSRAWRDS
jgi:hypothetical protein